jgi:arabinogalactan oligomer/maltooligosaccharide transport system permease protein
LYPYGYIAPSLVFMTIASFFPIIYTIYISLTNYGSGHIVSFDFVGLKNYADIFTNSAFLSDFVSVFIFTILFAAISTALNFAGGLILAYLLNNENMWERNFYRTVLIIPWALPGAIAILAWQGIFADQFGLVNTILTQYLHLPDIYFLGDAVWARIVVFIVNFWLGYPFMMTACLGALQSISPEVMQAAEVDGASAWQKFFRVTFPLLRAATLPLIISTFAYNLNNFGVVYLLTAGGPPIPGSSYAGSTDILATYTYKLALTPHLYGLACAYGVLIFIIVGTFSSINMKLSGAFEEVE